MLFNERGVYIGLTHRRYFRWNFGTARHKQVTLLQFLQPWTKIEPQQPGQCHRKICVYMDKSGFFVNQPSFPLANSAWLRIFCRFTKLGQKSRQAVGGREMSPSFLGPITCLMASIKLATRDRT